MRNNWDEYVTKWNLNKIPKEELSTFEDLLLEGNEKINITRITSPEDVEIKHFLDSLSIFSLRELEDVETMIDIGTGGGFPGIPAKLYRKDLKVTLVDSLNKRIRFLDEVIQKLDLKDIEAIHGRAEELGRNPKYREQYDLCVSRAVANLQTLSEYCLPFVKVGKYFLAMKGSEYKEEIKAGKNAISTLGGEIIKVQEIVLPENILHTLILIKKIKKTPKKYPRAGGKPKKNPI